MNIDSLSREEAISELKRICGEFVNEREKIIVIDDVLSESECRYIIEKLNNSQNLEKIRYLKDSKLGYSIREGKSYRIDEFNFKELDDFIYNKVAKRIYSVLSNNEYYMNYIYRYDIVDLGYEYCQYQEGEKLIEHVDNHFLHYGEPNFLGIETDVPYLPFIFASMSLHLNTLDEGGELVFSNQNFTVSQKAGRVVIWSPNHRFSHKTNPVKSNCVRHNIVTWYASRNIVGVYSKELTKG